MPSPEVERQVPLVPEKGQIIPETLKEETGVEEVKEPVFEPVVDKSGKPLVETEETREPILMIDEPVENYKRQEKGSILDSITWNAKMILRKVAKALFRGRKIQVGGGR